MVLPAETNDPVRAAFTPIFTILSSAAAPLATNSAAAATMPQGPRLIGFVLLLGLALSGELESSYDPITSLSILQWPRSELSCMRSCALCVKPSPSLMHRGLDAGFVNRSNARHRVGRQRRQRRSADIAARLLRILGPGDDDRDRFVQ